MERTYTEQKLKGELVTEHVIFMGKTCVRTCFIGGTCDRAYFIRLTFDRACFIGRT